MARPKGRRSLCYLFSRARRPNHVQQSSVLAEHVTRWNVVRQACCYAVQYEQVAEGEVAGDLQNTTRRCTVWGLTGWGRRHCRLCKALGWRVKDMSEEAQSRR